MSLLRKKHQTPELSDLSDVDLREYHRKLQRILGAVLCGIEDNNESIVRKGLVGVRKYQDNGDEFKKRQANALNELDLVSAELAKRILDGDN